MQRVKTKTMDKKRIFNWVVNILMIIIVLQGNYQSGFFTLGSLVAALGLVGTIGLAYKWKHNFWFNMLQNVFNVAQSGISRLFGDMFMAIFYFFSQIYGIHNWRNNTKKDGTIKIEQYSNWKVVIFSILIGFILLGGVSWWLGGAFIILDALNNSTAVVAQVLQMRRERASWLLWGATNVIGVFIWLGVGVPSMAFMYLAFSLNSLRGFIMWTENDELSK